MRHSFFDPLLPRKWKTDGTHYFCSVTNVTYLWNISYVSKMYRDKKIENLHFSVRKLFLILVHQWNFNTFLSHPTAPFLPVQLSIICLRSHVGVRETDFVIFADLRFLGCGAPTCDRRQIIDKWTGKNGAVGCDKKVLKFQWCT